MGVITKGFPGVARVNKVTPVSLGSLSVFNKNSTLKGPPERARAGGADQWVLKRRKFPGLSSWIKFRIPGIPTTSFQSLLSNPALKRGNFGKSRVGQWSKYPSMALLQVHFPPRRYVDKPLWISQKSLVSHG
jgi:hypothetical protein